MENCEVCGFEWDAVTAAEIPGRLRAAVAGHAAVLSVGGPRLAVRSSPETWSVVEYAAHVRDVMLNLRDRIICGVAEDNPTPKAMFGYVRISTGIYERESVELLPNELEVAMSLLIRTVEALAPELLERPIFYPWPVAATRTLLWVAAQALHEVEHHLADVRSLAPRPDLGRMYAAGRVRITEILTGADDTLPVPATPGWTVHDVVAHLRGVVGDALSGNMDGVTTDPWTAAQVERGRDVPTVQLLEEWNAEAPMIEAFLSSPAGGSAARAVIDVHTHEADLRGALGLPPALPDDYASFMFDVLGSSVVERSAAAGLPPLRIVTSRGDVAGPADAVATVHVDAHEFHRCALGRRSPDQVAAYDWRGADATRYVPHMSVFGPRTTPLVD